ncbi:MAG TPA: bifunctional adenosylcobinamide kinase/adenosylcobinamide-phosphate guanylyltransferase [Nitrospiraceae bacterium]|nr:bifunctional adenosylcobinamide kinase/adenosylcobinamide-phosphate guanylyltransferase [Nitrospiraceae bacterium]
MRRGSALPAGHKSRRARHLTLVIGGGASGKSAKALELAGRSRPRMFVATGQSLDKEMAERIRRHQAERGAGWETAEVPMELAAWFEGHRGRYRVIVLDCMTLWLSNLLGSGVPDTDIPGRVDELLDTIHRMRSRVIVVANELGLGVVPFDPETRRFRDLAGHVNQRLARAADEVYFVVGGCSVQVK